jgi:hypothetical protein
VSGALAITAKPVAGADDPLYLFYPETVVPHAFSLEYLAKVPSAWPMAVPR